MSNTQEIQLNTLPPAPFKPRYVYGKKLHPRKAKIVNQAIRRNAKGGEHFIAIEYTKEDGTKGTRHVRPFTVKRTKDRKHLIVGHDRDKGTVRSFRIDRMGEVKEASMNGFWGGFQKKGSLGGAIGKGSITGAILGALGGFGSSHDPDETAKNTLIGTSIGTGLGALAGLGSHGLALRAAKLPGTPLMRKGSKGVASQGKGMTYRNQWAAALGLTGGVSGAATGALMTPPESSGKDLVRNAAIGAAVGAVPGALLGIGVGHGVNHLRAAALADRINEREIRGLENILSVRAENLDKVIPKEFKAIRDKYVQIGKDALEKAKKLHKEDYLVPRSDIRAALEKEHAAALAKDVAAVIEKHVGAGAKVRTPYEMTAGSIFHDATFGTERETVSSPGIYSIFEALRDTAWGANAKKTPFDRARERAKKIPGLPSKVGLKSNPHRYFDPRDIVDSEGNKVRPWIFYRDEAERAAREKGGDGGVIAQIGNLFSGKPVDLGAVMKSLGGMFGGEGLLTVDPLKGLSPEDKKLFDGMWERVKKHNPEALPRG